MSRTALAWSVTLMAAAFATALAWGPQPLSVALMAAALITPTYLDQEEAPLKPAAKAPLNPAVDVSPHVLIVVEDFDNAPDGRYLSCDSQGSVLSDRGFYEKRNGKLWYVIGGSRKAVNSAYTFNMEYLIRDPSYTEEREKTKPKVFPTFPERLHDAPDGEYVSCKSDGSSLGYLDTLRLRKAGTVWLRYNSARSTWESVSAYTMATLTPYVRKDS